jgi:hypothetical protein
MAETTQSGLIIKRGSPSRRRHDDYDVLEDGVVVGRISKEPAAPGHRPWMWTSNEHKGRPPAFGYEATREAAMAAFVKSWRTAIAGDGRLILDHMPD